MGSLFLGNVVRTSIIKLHLSVLIIIFNPVVDPVTYMSNCCIGNTLFDTLFTKVVSLLAIEQIIHITMWIWDDFPGLGFARFRC